MFLAAPPSWKISKEEKELLRGGGNGVVAIGQGGAAHVLVLGARWKHVRRQGRGRVRDQAESGSKTVGRGSIYIVLVRLSVSGSVPGAPESQTDRIGRI